MPHNHPDALRWNARYSGRDAAEAQPATILTRFAEQLPSSGLALDLACGLGGSALWLARRGLVVDALDISREALDALEREAEGEGLEQLHTLCQDLTSEPLPESRYDLIVVVRYLDRDRCDQIAAALRPGGVLAYQTWVGPPGGPGPANPAYRLGNGELERLFAGLELVESVQEGGEALLLAKRGK